MGDQPLLALPTASASPIITTNPSNQPPMNTSQPGDIHTHLEHLLHTGRFFQGDIYSEIERIYKRLADFGARLSLGEAKEESLRREIEQLRGENETLRQENAVLKAEQASKVADEAPTGVGVKK